MTNETTCFGHWRPSSGLF